MNIPNRVGQARGESCGLRRHQWVGMVIARHRRIDAAGLRLPFVASSGQFLAGWHRAVQGLPKSGAPCATREESNARLLAGNAPNFEMGATWKAPAMTNMAAGLAARHARTKFPLQRPIAPPAARSCLRRVNRSISRSPFEHAAAGL